MSTIEVQVLNYDVKDVLIRGFMSSAYHISTPLLLGTSSHSLIAEFFLMCDGSKCHYGFALFLIIVIQISNLKEKD